VLLAACGRATGEHDSGAGDDATTPGPDSAPLDAGPPAEPCSERDPRDPAPEVFVGPEGLAERITAVADAAADSLRVATYELDAPAVLDALERAHGRGVDVRVLLDADRDANGPSAERLRAAGVGVREAPDTFEHYHSKVLVADGYLAVVTSANLNRWSMETERNHGVVLRDPFDVADLVAVFDRDWSGGTEPPIPSCTRLVLSPENSRGRIEVLVRSADDRLRLQQLSLTDDDVRAALVERAEAGVEVRVLLADPAWIESNAESAAFLRDAGIEVRFLRALENHAKLIVTDDDAAFVGSENLSWTSLERNREVGVVLTHTPSVAELAAAFESDWERSEPR